MKKDVLCALAALFLIACASDANATAKDKDAQQPVVYKNDGKSPAESAILWTPIEMRATTRPQLFQGSENKFHLAYELVLGNYLSKPATIDEIVVEDADSGKSILKLSGKDLSQNTVIANTKNKKETTSLAAGQNGTVFINIDFDAPDAVPKKLRHRLVASGADPIGSPAQFINVGEELEVDKTPALVIAPPFKGGTWIGIGGYAGVLGHRRALFPVNNGMYNAQRYAIDWLKIDEKGMAVKGDPTKCENYYGYGEPIYAVADGTVVGVHTGAPDQIPMKLIGQERIVYPAGNQVTLDLGNNRYAMYAHLKPDSIKVKVGDKLKRGDQIGQMGSSGNSTAPHLHLHVTDSPYVLGSNGVPYVFESFDLTKEVPDPKTFGKNDGMNKPLLMADSKFAGPHSKQLIRELHVVKFPE